MATIRIIKNEEVTEKLLDKVVEFDQSIFSVEEDYSFPDGYLKGVYAEHKEGMFVLLDCDTVVGYVNVLFMSDETFYDYLKTRDYLSLKNEGIKRGENNMYFYTLALSFPYRDKGYVEVLLRELFTWLNEQILQGKRLKNVICEVLFEDGIKPALKMGFTRLEGEERLGMYYSEDCLQAYMKTLLGNSKCLKKNNRKNYV